MRAKKLQVPAPMRDAQSLEESNHSPEGSDSDQDQTMNYLPSKSPSADHTGSPSQSAIDMLIQRTRGTNHPRFGDSDNSYHFSDEDETTQATSDPLEKLYLWVKTLQSHEKRNKELLKKLHAEVRQHRSLRIGVILLCALTVFLSLANIGTSLVAARLAKDSTVAGDDLVSMGGVRLGTTSKGMVVNMTPWDGSKRRRGLQLDSNDAPAKANFCTYAREDAACRVQGTITSGSASLLYESFCPGFRELGYCRGDGVDRLILNCNGRLSTLYGGAKLPPTPPTEADGFMAYPSETRGYVGEAAVYLFGRPLPCVQPFTVGMYCPTDEENMLTTESGEISDECLVFLEWEPGTCLGKVELCGASIVAPS